MTLSYLARVLADLAEQYGPDLDVVLQVADLHIDVISVSVVKLDYPPGGSVAVLDGATITR